MTDYTQLRIDLSPCTETVTDLLAAFLADVGYESFVPDDKGLTAFVNADDYDATKVKEILDSFPIDTRFDVTVEDIAGQDWNEEWEKNYFQPIVIGDKCVIHSTFHKNVPNAEYDIVIDPKMAFGTGHHFTTSLMIRYLLELNLVDKQVIDMGTGTGILAILAAMRGAREVLAIEIDPDACVNALENVAINAVESIDVRNGDASLLPKEPWSDLLLANINRNIITNDIDRYAAALKNGGTMLLSGFYEHDIPVIRAAAEACALSIVGFREDNEWVAVQLKKQ